MTSSNKTDCHNTTEVDKQLTLVVPLQNSCASATWQTYKSLKKIFEDTNLINCINAVKWHGFQTAHPI